MGHIVINGFDITIENPKGSYRRGKDKNGKEWKTLMHYDYGYFKHTLGKDGDAIDVFIGPYLNSNKIFCVDQFIDGKFDETKVMLGFNNKESAKKGYLKNYEKDWKGFKEITEVSVEDFKKWLYDGHKQRKPFYKYSDIKNYYITESQFKFIKNKLNENLELSWWEKCIEKYQKNGKIKLYHNTTKTNLEDILLSEELDVKMKHTEGHGDMLFFTVNPESWGNQCKISIEVPIDKFGINYNDFYFVNNIDVIYRNNISIKDFNFKIEKVGGLYFNEIVDKIKNDDDKINQYLSWDENFKDYINLGISNWFYDLVWGE
jgi:inorganic pyrophosphatase